MLGALLGAAASIGGSFMGKQAADKNIKMQKQFAKNGVQWKVEDAKKAGVHPLYALGAQTTSFQNVAGDWTQGIAQAGQDIGRAIDASQTQKQRIGSIEKQAAQLNLTKMGLENELLASRIAVLKQQSQPPAPGDEFVIPGQSSSGIVKVKPFDPMSTAPGAPHSEAASVSSMGYANTPGGGLEPVKSKDMQERLEDDHLGNMAWFIKNRLAPMVGVNSAPPNTPVPPGYDAWVYDPRYLEYRPMRQPKWMGKYGKYFHY